MITSNNGYRKYDWVTCENIFVYIPHVYDLLWSPPQTWNIR